MGVALLDTNVLFVSVSARDVYHDRRREIVRGIDHGELPEAIVTNYVVAETLNHVRERIGPDPAGEILDRLNEGADFEIQHALKEYFNTGQAIFRQHSELSFVDSTLVAFIHGAEIGYLYLFDDDFDAVERIIRLETADNPFN